MMSYNISNTPCPQVSGRIKCTIPNWTGLAFRIPRTSLEQCKYRDELKQTGIYLLFGSDEKTGRQVVYIGQARIVNGIIYLPEKGSEEGEN